MMATWEEIGEHWNRAQQMGWQAVQAAIEVGEELAQKKYEVPYGEFSSRVTNLGINASNCSRLMRLALHRDLIEQERPDSMRKALALLPKVPKKTSGTQLVKIKTEAEQMESLLTGSSKSKVEAVVKKRLKAELAELQNEAHDAVTKELKAVQAQLRKERERIAKLMEEADEKREFYEDLINRRMNGYDFKAGIRLLRQAIATDREVPSMEIRTKAMVALNHFAQFFGVAK